MPAEQFLNSLGILLRKSPSAGVVVFLFFVQPLNISVLLAAPIHDYPPSKLLQLKSQASQSEGGADACDNNLPAELTPIAGIPGKRPVLSMQSTFRSSGIKGLDLSFRSARIDDRFALIDGIFCRTGWYLKQMNPADLISVVDRAAADRSFTLKIPLMDDRASFSLVALGPEGEVEREGFVLSTRPSPAKKAPAIDRSKRPLRVGADLGRSRLDITSKNSEGTSSASNLISQFTASARISYVPDKAIFGLLNKFELHGTYAPFGKTDLQGDLAPISSLWLIKLEAQSGFDRWTELVFTLRNRLAKLHRYSRSAVRS